MIYIGFPQKSGDSKFLNGLAKFALNFGVANWNGMVFIVSASSMGLHKVDPCVAPAGGHFEDFELNDAKACYCGSWRKNWG